MLTGMSILSAVITAAVVLGNEMISASRVQQNNLLTMAEILSPNLTAAVVFNDTTTIKELISPLQDQQGVIYSQVTTSDNTLLASIGDSQSYSSYSNGLESFVTASTALTLDSQKYGELLILANRDYVEQRISFYIGFLVALLTAIFAGCILISYFLQKKFTKPILLLTSVARTVSNTNNYNIRASLLSNDEIGELTSHFNTMLRTIEKRDHLLESQVVERTHEIESVNKKLREKVYKDTLTSLPNRHSFFENLEIAIGSARQKKSGFALLFIDLDGFKEVNDTLGHDYGDILLIQVAERLRRGIRSTDRVARLGGDEFTIILNDVTDSDQISSITDIIRESIEQAFNINNKRAFVTASIGITIYPNNGISGQQLIKQADQAMYVAKSHGRNRYYYFTEELEFQATARRQIADNLRNALESSQFVLYFQPIINLQTGTISKAEALIRWQHPTRGLLGPLEFIPIAEEMGLIIDIGNWVLSEAIKVLSRWRTHSSEFELSINASPVQFTENSGWIARWLEKMKLARIPGKAFSIEITENLLMESNENTRHQLSMLHNEGVSISLDDFGVGYSSLSYLQKLDIDILKIDRSFVKGLENSNDSETLCKTIIVMAHQLGLQVVAEGIENSQQQTLLVDAGCDYGQGFLFSKPIPEKEFFELYVCREHQYS